jgi:hypothetical protein
MRRCASAAARIWAIDAVMMFSGSLAYRPIRYRPPKIISTRIRKSTAKQNKRCDGVDDQFAVKVIGNDDCIESVIVKA